MGCGIGPLDRGERYEEAVKKILRLADFIELRDSASVAWASRMTGRKDITVSGDPAIRFVERWKAQHPFSETNSSLNMYLRSWTKEYQGSLTDKQFIEIKERFELQLGKWVHELCTQLRLRPRLFPMHHFNIGDDDRDFNRRFASTYLSHLNPYIERAPLSLQEILLSMKEASLSLCMRYHSVLFANVLAVPFFAIDYTHGGKIAFYLADHGLKGRTLPLLDIADGKWHKAVMKAKELISQRNH